MKATKKQIMTTYCNFIGRNIEYSGLCDWKKVPKNFYSHLEVVE